MDRRLGAPQSWCGRCGMDNSPYSCLETNPSREYNVHPNFREGLYEKVRINFDKYPVIEGNA